MSVSKKFNIAASRAKVSLASIILLVAAGLIVLCGSIYYNLPIFQGMRVVHSYSPEAKCFAIDPQCGICPNGGTVWMNKCYVKHGVHYYDRYR